MKKMAISIGIIIALLGLLFVFTRSQNSSSETDQSNEQQSTDNSIQTIKLEENQDLLAGGSSYLDEKGLYSLLYPADYQIDSSDPLHVRLVKRGPMDRPQGEITNGVLLVLENVDLENEDLGSYLEQTLAQIAKDEIASISEGPKEIILNQYHGFYYKLKGFGESEVYLLQKETDSNYALAISVVINDPDNMNYQREVNSILASLEILK